MVGYGTLFYPVHISKIMIEIRIMQPHNYPTAPRQFDLVYNSACKGNCSQPFILPTWAVWWPRRPFISGRMRHRRNISG